MANYVDLCLAKQNPALSDLDEVTLYNLMTATCLAVEHYCNRVFGNYSYDELYTGNRTRSLFLKQSPVTAITGIRYGRLQALQISNSHTTYQAANVTVAFSGLTLTAINNASPASTSLLFSSYPTVGALSTAINALGGWSCTLNPQFASWSSADLGAYVGTYSARGVVASICPHYYYLSDYKADYSTGEIVSYCGWGTEFQGVRVQYTAGFSPVPEDLIAATIELAASTQLATKSDPNLQSESLGQYSYTRAATKGIDSLSIAARQTLNYYKRYTVPFFKVGV